VAFDEQARKDKPKPDCPPALGGMFSSVLPGLGKPKPEEPPEDIKQKMVLAIQNQADTYLKQLEDNSLP
jgi:hypothetical protein